MGIFGSHKSPKEHAGDIPEEVYRQVRVMGDIPSRAFSESVEPSPEAPVSGKGSRQGAPEPSPFLGEADARPAARPSAPAASAVPPKNLPLGSAPDAVPIRLSESLQTGSAQSRSSRGRKYLVWGLSAALLVAIVSGIAYFVFFMNAPVQTPEADLAPPVESAAPEAPDASEPLPFSLTGANYLPINTETSTKESILGEIAAQEAKIAGSGISAPVKFLVTDQNNIPIAFSRFAFLLGLPLDDEFVNTLEESFSLYLYDDGGTVRRALVLSIDTEQARFLDEQLASLEGELPEAMRAIFYVSESFDLRNPSFSTGNFNGNPVRYVNFDIARNYSFDYLKTNALLIFGNSKNMVRAVLSAEESAK